MKPIGIKKAKMAKIIFTSRYIRNAFRAGNLVKYMGTREGVEKLPYGVDHSPATKKQDDLIASIVKKYPASVEYPEYIEYQQKKEKASATEFIDAFVERNSDRIGNFKKLVSYIAERPSVEKLGRHGLFSQTDDKIDLDAVANEVASHQGILWTHVISLRREDAERLGYNNAEAWKKAIRRNVISIAEAHKIKVSDLRWYAAFHNTTHHPHVHLLVYSRDPRTGYLTNKGIESMRSVFARDLFRNEQYKLFRLETQQRDLLKQTVNKLLDNMDVSREASPELVALFQTLVMQLDVYPGKRVYGYLPKPMKETVNKIVDELAKDPTVSQMYDTWCKINRAKLSVYSEKEKPPVPLSENDVFRSIKNTILQKSVYLLQLSHIEGLTKETFQHSCGSFYKGLSTILAKLIGSDCHKKLNHLEGQVDSKLRQQINEKKVAQGLKISYTPVDNDDEDEDEDEGFGFIL